MKKILVIDDDPDIVDFVTGFLEMASYETQGAENGRVGVEKALQFFPDLVILDLMMPDMHGFEVCEAIRANEKLKNVRIIVSSGKRYQTDQRASDRLGANVFVQKPYKVEQMIQAVESLIGKPNDPLPAAPPQPPAPPAPPA